jgi:cold shock CspA family protein
VEQATVYRWNIRAGTGVLSRSHGPQAWFHISSVAAEDVFALKEGDQVVAGIENVSQGNFECRAVSVRKRKDAISDLTSR